MATIITIFNQAGGVAKTTLAHNLAYHLGRKNSKVLLVDLDPQASLTTFMGYPPQQLTKTIYQSLVLSEELPIIEDSQGVDLVPANIHLCAAEQELTAQFLKELKLKKALSAVTNEYDLILLDCPPSLGLLSVLGLAAATHILIPIHCHYKAFMGTDQLLLTISRVQKEINPSLRIAGVIPTMLDKRASQDHRMLTAIQEQLGKITPIFPAIPRSVAFADASEAHLPLALYKQKHPSTSLLDLIADQLLTL